jgi:hypothetical protein
MPGGNITLVVRGTDYARLVADFVSDLLFNSYDIKANGPRVVAVNGDGQECVVADFKSKRKAKAAFEEWSREISELGAHAWNTENELDLPADFLD